MKKKSSVGDKIFVVFNYIVMALLMFICLYPFYYIFIYSISDPDLAKHGLTFIPKGLTLMNYEKAFRIDGILPAAGVSVARTVLGTALATSCSVFLGYLFTKPMYCRKFFYRMLVATMYISGGIIPTFFIWRAYGLLDNFLVYIIPGCISAYNIILCKTFVENLPVGLEESAKLDGAGTFTIFARIVAPLSKPIVASMVVFDSVAQWNSWVDNKMYASDGNKTMDTLQLVLYNYLNQTNRLQQILQQLASEGADISDMAAQITVTPMSIRMTITMIVMFPILCVYPYMQKFFVKGLMVGAIKG